ncbi:hypothetical protein LBMAG27_12630 [Bacteroidota bacterium]|nr:hypothetical protein LBMAG27_12630 [Bacteroidota bacterium]
MRLLLFTFILLSFFPSAYSQSVHGLEKIIVEKYYVSDSADSKASGGNLPVGSVTYRIFVDLLPAYRLQAVYGVPGHVMQIATTTSFFNNADDGAAIANYISSDKLKSNTLMVDSWLSVGAAAENYIGMLKSDDTEKPLANSDGLLHNADSSTGIPLNVRDGMFQTHPVSVVTLFGIDSAMLSLFGKKNSDAKGQVFSTDNGSWASFGGSIGVHPMNRVLIAQLTTDGELSFQLNIQIGTPDGKVENYVAENPVGNEILFPELTFHSK